MDFYSPETTMTLIANIFDPALILQSWFYFVFSSIIAVHTEVLKQHIHAQKHSSPPPDIDLKYAPLCVWLRFFLVCFFCCGFTSSVSLTLTTHTHAHTCQPCVCVCVCCATDNLPPFMLWSHGLSIVNCNSLFPVWDLRESPRRSESIWSLCDSFP